ncbi:MAG TPA: hypothetical protein VMH90_07230 [Thermoplasmata archaeon]|nr:hypothetical protein [Thermoplasmata archaeon]
MSAFNLSPGITPEVVGLATIALPLAIAVGYGVRGRAGFEIAIGLVTMALGLYKFATDWNDPWDLPLAIGGITVGLTVIGAALDRPELRWMPGPVWRACGAFAVFIGLWKVGSDFLDPFDIELGALLAGLGLWVLLARDTFARFRLSSSAS